MSDAFKIALAGVLIVALLIGVWFGVMLFRRETAAFRGDVGAQERVQSAPFRIAAYDRFFSLCAAVRSDEARLRALEEELEDGVDADREAQVRASITAVRAAREGKIERYNADARREYTVGQFRDSGLPFQLDPTEEETRCDV